MKEQLHNISNNSLTHYYFFAIKYSNNTLINNGANERFGWCLEEHQQRREKGQETSFDKAFIKSYCQIPDSHDETW